MGVGRWVREHMTADDGYVEDPDAVVTVAEVSTVVGAIVLVRCAEAEVEARVVDLRAGYRGIPRAQVMCFARDREAVTTIVDQVLTESRDDGA